MSNMADALTHVWLTFCSDSDRIATVLIVLIHPVCVLLHVFQLFIYVVCSSQTKVECSGSLVAGFQPDLSSVTKLVTSPELVYRHVVWCRCSLLCQVPSCLSSTVWTGHSLDSRLHRWGGRCHTAGPPLWPVSQSQHRTRSTEVPTSTKAQVCITKQHWIYEWHFVLMFSTVCHMMYSVFEWRSRRCLILEKSLQSLEICNYLDLQDRFTEYISE